MSDTEFADLIKNLPEESRQKLIEERNLQKEHARRAAAAAVMARNFSHNIGNYAVGE